MSLAREPTPFQPPVLVKPTPPRTRTIHFPPGWASFDDDYYNPYDSWDADGSGSDAENSKPTAAEAASPIEASNEPGPITTAITDTAEDIAMDDIYRLKVDDDRGDSDSMPSLFSPSDSDSLDDTDHSEDDSMSLGSSDTFSTDTDTSSNSLSSFIVPSDDESEISSLDLTHSFEIQKRSHEDIAGREATGPSCISESEEEHPRKFRRLYLPPRSIHDNVTQSKPVAPSPTLPTYVSTGGSDVEPIRPDFMARATNTYFAKEKFKPAYALSSNYKGRKASV